jgi:hypothetical protein
MTEDPIVAEVRKARSEILEKAGRDLKELARQLNERARASGRKVVKLDPKRAKG